MQHKKTILINNQNITSQVTGGELAGALKFRDEVLDPAQNQLGLIAAGFATEFNALQTSGRDLNGNVGTALFNFGTPAIPVFANQSGPGTLTASYSAPSTNLAASDYLLSYDGTNYQLKQLSDNTTTTYAGSPITGPGFTLTPSGLNAGDSFLVRPTLEAAKKAYCCHHRSQTNRRREQSNRWSWRQYQRLKDGKTRKQSRFIGG